MNLRTAKLVPFKYIHSEGETHYPESVYFINNLIPTSAGFLRAFPRMKKVTSGYTTIHSSFVAGRAILLIFKDQANFDVLDVLDINSMAKLVPSISLQVPYSGCYCFCDTGIGIVFSNGTKGFVISKDFSTISTLGFASRQLAVFAGHLFFSQGKTLAGIRLQYDVPKITPFEFFSAELVFPTSIVSLCGTDKLLFVGTMEEAFVVTVADAENFLLNVESLGKIACVDGGCIYSPKHDAIFFLAQDGIYSFFISRGKAIMLNKDRINLTLDKEWRSGMLGTKIFFTGGQISYKNSLITTFLGG